MSKWTFNRGIDTFAIGDEVPAGYVDEEHFEKWVKNGIVRKDEGFDADELAEMTMNELRRIADQVGADTARSKDEIIANIKAARG